MEKNRPAVSVIVCHHKGSFIYNFVDSVKKSKAITFEIIVVTSDETLAMAGIDGCIVINGPPMPAAKRNMGARIAKANWLAFFDDDVEIDELCLFEFYTSKTAMAYGKLHNGEYRNRFDEAGGYLTFTGFIWSRAGQNDIDTGQFDKEERILAGKSASCMIDKDLFNLVGGFDEDFGILGEETDLSWRVWLAGYSVFFIPTAKGVHYFNTKWKPAKDYYTSDRVHYNGCRNYITMLIKNLEAKNLWKILPIHILIWAIAGLLMFVTGKFTQGLNIYRGLFYIPKNLKMILKKRRKVQSARVVTDEFIWPWIFRWAPRGYYTQRFARYLRIGLHG